MKDIYLAKYTFHAPLCGRRSARVTLESATVASMVCRSLSVDPEV